MELTQIPALPRKVRGSRACRRLRREGRVPVIMYGRQQGNSLLSISLEDAEFLVREHAYIVELQLDGESENAQIREIQYDALGDDILHLDMVRISLTETITVSVPVDVHGEPEGLEEGGTLDIELHELEVECLPTNIPENIRVEVAHLGIGDTVRVSDAEIPDGVTCLEDPEAPIASVVPPQQEAEEPEELLETEILAEPEVIGREEEEEEEEPEEA